MKKSAKKPKAKVAKVLKKAPVKAKMMAKSVGGGKAPAKQAKAVKVVKAGPSKKELKAAKAAKAAKVAKVGKNAKAPVAPPAPKEALKGKAAKAAPSPMQEAAPGKKGKGKGGETSKTAGTPPAQMAAAKEEEVVLTNAEGEQYCRVHDCDNAATTEGYCRLHYIALWKRNKVKAKILQGGKLDKYIEDLTAKYPDKYLEMLRKDLSSEKDFNLIIAEMDVEDSSEEVEQEEDTNRFIEEVRGGIPTPDDDEGSF